ncbi:MAG: hypothetical protein HWE25_03730 [Alphaproteobacteria bacterium]|nr:hypothetical protein [Alphaproteobacteria bacterium]
MRNLLAATMLVAVTSTISQANAVTVLETLASQCGKAFEGKVVRDTENSAAWAEARIVMHVRDCGAEQIKIPLHVGDNRSRVWVLTRLDSDKVQLKHDHRHEDGHSDDVTMYGGIADAADAPILSFPVDQESITMFEANGLSASVRNTWHMRTTGDVFQYQLTRPSGRDFIVEFDLTKPVPAPPAAWDMQGH